MFSMDTMFGNVPTFVARKCVGSLVTGLALAILVADSGAADLPRRINARHLNADLERFVADRRQISIASVEARKKLFDEFILWRAAREHR
jgi:hypothetical protein